MSKKHNVIRIKPIPEAFKGQVYLDPTYDPAFKEQFVEGLKEIVARRTAQ